MDWVREVALKRAAATAAAWVVGTLVVTFGFDIGPEAEQGLVAFTVALLGALLTLAQGYWTRAGVTPLADPRNAQGAPLVPVAGGDSFPGSNFVGLD